MSDQHPPPDRDSWARTYVICAVLLFIPILISASVLSALAAWANFILGAVSGVLAGSIWWQSERSRFGLVDVGLLVLIVQIGLQVLEIVRSGLGTMNLSPYSYSTVIHNTATEWGGSNYIAGCLVVACFLSLARLTQCPKENAAVKTIVILVDAAGIALSILTFSRGAVIASAVAGMLFLFVRAKSVWSKALALILAPVLSVTAVFLISSITVLRFGTDVMTLNGRDAIWHDAWISFLHHPVLGTGWVSLRVSLSAASFAHNLVLSFLQIGGLLGVVFLSTVLARVLSMIRYQSVFLGALAAGLAISMTDSFVEGAVGGTLFAIALTMGRQSIAADDARCDHLEIFG